jgi:hypothetical protein
MYELVMAASPESGIKGEVLLGLLRCYRPRERESMKTENAAITLTITHPFYIHNNR